MPHLIVYFVDSSSSDFEQLKRMMNLYQYPIPLLMSIEVSVSLFRTFVLMISFIIIKICVQN